MVIRCICGNETHIHPGGNPGYILSDESWFDKESGEPRCPKCKSNALPLEVIDAAGPIKVKVVPGKTIRKKYAWT